MQKLLSLLLCVLLGGCARLQQSAPSTGGAADEAFDRLADEYLTGYLAWRPQTGTALGFHQYDGKVTDLSRPSLEAELVRLKSFEQRLLAMNARILSPQAAYDYRILRGAIQREIFGFQQMKVHSRN